MLPSSSRSRLLAELNDLSLTYDRLSEEARVLALERAVKRRLQSIRASLSCLPEPSFTVHGASRTPDEETSGADGGVGLGSFGRAARDGQLRVLERSPKEGPQDPRIRTIVYNRRDVVRIDGTYGYHTVVELAEDEQIQGMVIGDSVAWEAEKNAAGNRISSSPRKTTRRRT